MQQQKLRWERFDAEQSWHHCDILDVFGTGQEFLERAQSVSLHWQLLGVFGIGQESPEHGQTAWPHCQLPGEEDLPQEFPRRVLPLSPLDLLFGDFPFASRVSGARAARIHSIFLSRQRALCSSVSIRLFRGG